MKTKTMHAPGPWTYQDDPNTGDRIVVDDNFMVICARPNEADARLIAAAPQMYHILSAILKHLRLNENVSRSALILGGEDEYLGKAIADVIANAEGRR